MRRLEPIRAPGVTGPVARVRDLLAAGVPPARLYASDQARPLHGIVSVPGVDPHAFDIRIAAAELILREGSFFSRRTAARLHGIPLSHTDESSIELGAVRPARPPDRPGFRTHQLRPGALLELPRPPHWLPCAADTWALLGAVSDVERLVIAGDFIVSGKSRGARPLASIEALSAATARFAGCSGSGRLRTALPLLRTGVESPAETRTRLLILGAGFPEPITSCPVQTAERLYFADLGYPQWKIAIEYQGAYHFAEGVERARFDNERYEAMRAAGWRVLLVTALDLRDPRRFLARLAEAIAA